MSILKVDTINEKTTGNGVHIPGHVVQVQQNYQANVSHTTISSTSLVASGFSKAITPKFSNSKIWVRYNATMVDAITTDVAVYGRMYVNGAEWPGTARYNIGYQSATHTRYAPMTFDGVYSVTSTSQLTFEPYFRGNTTDTVRIAHQYSDVCLTLVEIAQ